MALAELFDLDRQPPECHTHPVYRKVVDPRTAPKGRWMFVNQRLRELRSEVWEDGRWIVSFEWWNPSKRRWEPRVFRSDGSDGDMLMVICGCHIEMALPYSADVVGLVDVPLCVSWRTTLKNWLKKLITWEIALR